MNSHGDESVGDSASQHRRFQFSLRKLMPWTAAWAVCLSVLRLLLVCFAAVGVQAPLSVAVILTMYLAVLLPIHIKWKSEQSARIAVLGTFVAVACLVEIQIVMDRWAGRSCFTLLESLWVRWPALFVSLFLNAVGFVFVHLLVVVMDWIGRLMQMKPRQEP